MKCTPFIDKTDRALYSERSEGHLVPSNDCIQESFAKGRLGTPFPAPNHCGQFDNAGAMVSVDGTLLCSLQVRDP
jgi:hypothetical protein